MIGWNESGKLRLGGLELVMFIPPELNMDVAAAISVAAVRLRIGWNESSYIIRPLSHSIALATVR